MITPPSTCPAAHSMDTEWFALDEKGRLGVFFTSEQGALPNAAFADQEAPLLEHLTMLLMKEQTLPWRKRLGEIDSEEIALVMSATPKFKALAKRHGLEPLGEGAFATDGELDPEDLEAWLADGTVQGFATRDDLEKWLGLARFEHAGEGSGDYARLAPPKKSLPLTAEVKRTYGRLKLPVDFSKARTLSLSRFMKESQVSVWESGLSFDGGAAEAAQAAKEPRRFEFVEGTSKKFWEVRIDGTALVVRFGRIGTEGQTQKKAFTHVADAVAEAEKLIEQKTRKGYSEVTGGSEPVDAAAPAFDFAALGVTPPPGKRITTASTEQFDEAVIEFGAGGSATKARAEFVVSLGLWSAPYDLELPTALEAVASNPKVPAGRSFLVGLPGRAFAQTLGDRVEFLRFVRLKDAKAPFSKRLDGFTAQRAQIDAAFEQLMKKAGKQRVVGLGPAYGSTTLELHTQEAAERHGRTFAKLGLFKRSAIARERAFWWHSAAAAATIDLPKVPSDALRAVADARLKTLQQQFGAQVTVASRHGDASDDAWEALGSLKPEELVETLVANDDWFEGALEGHLEAFIKEEPEAYAPALAAALLKDPTSDVLSRQDWIFTQPSLKKQKGNTAFMKVLKALFAKTKRKRFATALHLIGLPAPKTGPDGLTVLNADDYR